MLRQRLAVHPMAAGAGARDRLCRFLGRDMNDVERRTKNVGDGDPTLTYTADALLGTDTYSGTLTRDPGETSGTYAITQGSLSAGSNYAINVSDQSKCSGNLNVVYSSNTVTNAKIGLTNITVTAG